MERVWRAITDPAEMSAWFPSDVEGDRAVGSELVFVDDAQRAEAQAAGEPTRAEGPMLRGVVIAHDAPKVFSFTWGGELLRFELRPDGEDTVLLFTHLLSDDSVAARNGSGWHMCLAELDRLLGADGAVDVHWEAVYDDYLHRMGPALGAPSGNGSMTWERSTHVDPEQVRAATSGATEIDRWGGAERSRDPVRWEINATEQGTTYRLTHDSIGTDAELAATWHALLIQLDMYLAAGQLVPVEHEHWVAAYESVL